MTEPALEPRERVRPAPHSERRSAGLDVTDADAVERHRRRIAVRNAVARAGLYLAAVAAALIAAAPFLWGTITAFKQDADLYNPQNNPFAFNLPPTGEHVRFLFEQTDFLTFAWNTAWVALLVVAITLLLGLPAAYSLARLEMPWAGPLGIAIFFVYLIPPTLLFISLSRVVAWLGLQDSTWSLVVVYPTITIPVSVWLLIGFIKGIPRDIEEQAMIDGYSRVGAFVRTVVPLTFPGIVAVVVFAFTLTAHEFIYALAFVAPSAEKTISVGVPTELIRGDVFFWQSLQAAAVVTAIPIAFVFNLLLERFIAGFTMGAVKT
jgi:multiple sugar transport system permease protein